VVVAGRGPAGTAAAVCAARLGAKVFLAEATGCLGGMGTSGLVSAFDPMANGEIQLVRGFMGEVVEAMYEKGFMQSEPSAWRTAYHAWSRFNPEGYKYVLDRKVEDANVKVRFFTRVIEAAVDPAARTVRGVITSNVEGMKYIKAEYVFNKTDMETRRLFPDTIGVYCKACDIHPYEYSDKAMKDHEELYRRNKKYRPGHGEMFAMPYGILVPKGWKNLWTADRCARADIIGQGSLRCQPYCSQMGQAAGTAAVQALEHGQSADNLNTEQLVKALRQQDVYLPQEKLSSEMTRS
jgi:hypothetical protein